VEFRNARHPGVCLCDNRHFNLKKNKIMTQDNLISQFRNAGYHQDAGQFVRLFDETRISQAVAIFNFVEGYRERKHGKNNNLSTHPIQA
jgi:hypothetical protein